MATVHMILGMALVVSAIVLVIVGFFPRRDHRRWLAIRLAVLIALVLTGVAGALAGQGTRDLLIVHIPLAIVSMGNGFPAVRRRPPMTGQVRVGGLTRTATEPSRPAC